MTGFSIDTDTLLGDVLTYANDFFGVMVPIIGIAGGISFGKSVGVFLMGQFKSLF